MIWFISAAHRDARNHEFSTIVSSIRDFEKSNSCNLKTNIERDLLLTWSPGIMDVSMWDSENIIEMRTYGLFPPDRIEQDRYEYLYRYNTNGRKNDMLVSSYLQFELDKRHNLKWIEMGECEGVEESEYWKYRKAKKYDSCTDPIVKIICQGT